MRDKLQARKAADERSHESHDLPRHTGIAEQVDTMIGQTVVAFQFHDRLVQRCRMS